MAKAATKKRGPPQKVCPKCGNQVHAAKRKCDKCEYEFPPKASKNGEVKTGTNKRMVVATSGDLDIVAVLTLQKLVQKYGATALKQMVDLVATANVPF
jgi:hypothetical protein